MVSKKLEDKVVVFYNNEIVSRWTPGKQEYVIIRNKSNYDNSRRKTQKSRLGNQSSAHYDQKT